MEKKERKKGRGMRPTAIFLRLFLLMFIGTVAVGFGSQANRYQELLEERVSLQVEIDSEKERQIEYKKQQEYYNSDTYIEQMAREYLGMVKPNEILYISRGE